MIEKFLIDLNRESRGQQLYSTYYHCGGALEQDSNPLTSGVAQWLLDQTVAVPGSFLCEHRVGRPGIKCFLLCESTLDK